MPSAQADRVFQAGRPRLWVAGLVLCALVGSLAFFLLTRPEEAVLPSQHHGAPTEGVATRADSASELLEKLTARLQNGTRQQAQALAAPGGRAAQELGVIFDNVRRLGVTDLSMRYIDEDAGRLSVAASRRLGHDAWVGDVQLDWRLAKYDTTDSSMETTLSFEETDHGAAFLSARGDYGHPAPLWLLERLSVKQSRRSLVMVADRSRVNRYARQADHAVSDVRKVLPGWRGKLVIEVPATEGDLGRALDADQHVYDAIAAITTTVDGSLSRTAPTHIFVNPGVFDGLGPHGAQIVVSHEATHVATHAAASSMPMWLLEGFADYVALAHVDLPVSVTASQILGDVRKHGAPGHLPGPTEFDPANKALGASYESAWLACRLVAEEYGEQKLIAFYRQADRDAGTDRAFRDVLGTNERAFTHDWQAYLRRLAS